MKGYAAELVGLAAIWGASFLFMRLGAGEFGPVALVFVRVAGATALLLPWLATRGQLALLRRHAGALFVVGLTNSALPFLAFGYAALSISGGLSAVFNATAPLFAAVIAWAWLRDAPDRSRVAGLAIGFAGVVGLVWGQASFKPGGSGWAVSACLGATVLYGFSASFTKRYLTGVPALAVAAGSQLSAAACLAVPAWLWWPEQTPSRTAWMAAALLAVLCTGLAYLMYFRLIARLGPARAISVTFLIPAFAMLWGGIFLHEQLTLSMVAGCAVILLGTSLAAGVWRWPLRLPHGPPE